MSKGALPKKRIMNLILLGAPGAGKGTQAFKLAEKYNLPHISTGDIFRQNIHDNTPLGQLAKSFIDRGQLVPDDVTIEIVKDRISQEDCKNGYMLDGFPRTVAQAEALEKICDDHYVLDIEIPFERLLHRLTGRRVCEKCGESYHVDFLGDNRVCHCGGKLIHRDDDTEKTVTDRINVYHAKTEPLIAFYQSRGKLISINGDQNVDLVFEEIVEKLSKL